MLLQLIICTRSGVFFLCVPLIAHLQFCRVQTQAKCERCRETSRPQSKYTKHTAIDSCGTCQTTSLGLWLAATQSHERLFAGWSTRNLELQDFFSLLPSA